MNQDPYILNSENIKEAPGTFFGKLKYLSGFIYLLFDCGVQGGFLLLLWARADITLVIMSVGEGCNSAGVRQQAIRTGRL